MSLNHNESPCSVLYAASTLSHGIESYHLKEPLYNNIMAKVELHSPTYVLPNQIIDLGQSEIIDQREEWHHQHSERERMHTSMQNEWARGILSHSARTKWQTFFTNVTLKISSQVYFLVFSLKFHWNVFPMALLSIRRHRRRYWFGEEQTEPFMTVFTTHKHVNKTQRVNMVS